MDMIRVSSSAIKAIGYDHVSCTMRIAFKQGGSAYTFCNVPQTIFDGFIASHSKGRYYDYYIKGKYRC